MYYESAIFFRSGTLPMSKRSRHNTANKHAMQGVSKREINISLMQLKGKIKMQKIEAYAKAHNIPIAKAMIHFM
jgi:hypothetical protein